MIGSKKIGTLLLLGLALLGIMGRLAWGATTARNVTGTIDTWLTSSVNLTNGSRIVSSTVTVTNAGYLRADCELNAPSWSGTVTANTGVSVWLIEAPDNTNFEDGDASTEPARMPDFTFPLRNVSTAQRVTRKEIKVPIIPFKVLLKNDGTGVTLQGATSAYTLKCTPWTIQNQ